MIQKKKKILVLSTLNQDLNSTMQNAVSLAEMINAEIDFFYVKRPTEIVKKESQLSAMRTINKEQVLIDKQLRDLLEPYSVKFNIDINRNFSFGNVKNEIELYINKSKPDIIVLGKRKINPLSFTGDKITEFILKTFNGPVLIASSTNLLQSEKDLSIGVINSEEVNKPQSFLNELMERSTSPLKSFRIIEKGNDAATLSSTDDKTINFLFEKNDSSIKNLSNYLMKSKVNLLYMNRDESSVEKDQLKTIPLKKIMNHVNVPLLLTKGPHIGWN